MCLPFLNLFVRYDALLLGWCVAYVGDVSKGVNVLKRVAIDGVINNKLNRIEWF
jgi:hypothetical protein